MIDALKRTAVAAARIEVDNPATGEIVARVPELGEFAERMSAGSLAPHEMAIFSAHQMGSCRMGVDPQTSVAGPWGELHDVKGVWIGDASAFPTSSGVNPMITIMALAHRTAEAIAAEAT